MPRNINKLRTKRTRSKRTRSKRTKRTRSRTRSKKLRSIKNIKKLIGGTSEKTCANGEGVCVSDKKYTPDCLISPDSSMNHDKCIGTMNQDYINTPHCCVNWVSSFNEYI